MTPAAIRRLRSSSLAFTRSIYALSLLITLICFVSQLPTAGAFNAFILRLDPYEKRCFFENLKKGERLDLSFEVSEGGNLDIDFWINAPDSSVLYSVNRQPQSTFGFFAELEGQYTYCFSNEMSSVTDKLVSFVVRGPDEHAKLEEKVKSDDPHHEPLNKEIQVLVDGIKAIKDEQSYMVQRDIAHRATAESTKSRIVWWSLLQSVLLIAVCLFQVSYLKR